MADPPARLDRTVDLVVVRAREVLDPARTRRLVAALSPARLDVVLLAGNPDDPVLAACPRPTGPGRVQLRGPDGGWARELTADGPRALAVAARVPVLDAVLADASARGIGAGLVLVVLSRRGDRALLSEGTRRCVVVAAGDRHGPLPAGTARFPGPGAVAALLSEQLGRRCRRRVPALDPDPAWTLREPDPPPERRRVVETLTTVAAGGLASRGVAEEDRDPAIAPVLAAGVYRGRGAAQALRPLPRWADLRLDPAPGATVRTLDLRTGVLLREEGSPGPGTFRSLRVASPARPGVVALRAEAAAGRLRPGRVPAAAEHGSPRGGPPRRRWATTPSGAGSAVAVAVGQRVGRDRGVRTVERVGCYAVGGPAPRLRDALDRLSRAEAAGFDALLAESRRTWAARWDDVDLRVPDDPEAQRGLRFALFTLWGLAPVPPDAELAVGARGATGPGYRGHVFWDADVFVLPALVAVAPGAARAVVRYRIARLPAARRRARAAGHDGARFPWESAQDGEEVTPHRARLRGRTLRVRTGALEEHITADVAWAAAHYAAWVHQPAFLAGPARPLLLDTARYWRSRCTVDDAGAAHLDHVIGPDEYHEDVDDDAFTNGMARWNLRAAADLLERLDPGSPEPTAWRSLAGRLVDGLTPSGRHEQFAGYDARRPLLAREVAEPPVAADLLLGRARVGASQLIKQPDVLMLHHLVPGEAGPASLVPDVEHYAPRTAHGSSLSPGISAAVLARAGRTEEALALLHTGLALDLDDLTDTTAEGLHLAAAGASVQAVVQGFLGVRVERGTLVLDPRLPAAWPRLEARFRLLGAAVRIEVDPAGVVVRTDRPLRVRLGDRAAVRVVGAGHLGPAVSGRRA
ncbi:MAG TPA: glycosyl hydrolase family 65 protein [Actinomycetospora sp.]|uniref:glycosyl hydrolase family 65 protein n=1 Tax=Actinomycetospora sp. TaxID=1872135 RepID=UPI002F3E6E6C